MDFGVPSDLQPDSEVTQARIREQIASDRVVLYMKGTPTFPQCGFSARVADILAQQGVAFTAVNVLEDPSIREGIKIFSDWPTIPQLYVAGEFIGGCDILVELDRTGQLAGILAES